jgi:hypothetical protein
MGDSHVGSSMFALLSTQDENQDPLQSTSSEILLAAGGVSDRVSANTCVTGNASHMVGFGIGHGKRARSSSAHPDLSCPYCEHPSKYRLTNGKDSTTQYACKCKSIFTCNDCALCKSLIKLDDTRCLCPARTDCTCSKAYKEDGLIMNRLCISAVDGKAVCE